MSTDEDRKKIPVSTITVDMSTDEGEPRVYISILPMNGEDGKEGFGVAIGIIPKKVYVDIVSRMNAANKKLKEMIANGEQPELRDMMEFVDALAISPTGETSDEGITRVKKYDYMYQ